jgi:bacterioferritin-associated ferredoxin
MMNANRGCENGMGFALAVSSLSRFVATDRHFGAPMIVCSCNVLSDTKIRASLNAETCPKTPGALYKCLGCSPNCGRCLSTVRTIMTKALAEANFANAENCSGLAEDGGESFLS